MNKRPLAVVGFIYVTALAIAARLDSSISFTIAIMAAILGVAACFIAPDYRKQIFIVSIPIFIGFAIIGISVNYYDNVSISLGEKSCIISGEVTDIPQKKYGRWIYNVKTDYIDIDSAPQSIKIRLTCRNSLEVYEGDKITGRVTFIKTRSESGYDNQIALRADGIAAHAYCYPYYEMTVSNSDFSLRYVPQKIRRFSIKAIRQAIPGKYSGMLCAMLLGDTTYIDDNIADNFRASGIAHLMAVSGLHVSLLVSCVMSALIRFKVMPKPRFIITISIVVFFMAITGFSPSVVRAGIMHLMTLTAQLIMRDADSITSLALSLLIMCVINPMNAADIGLQLSACSTVGLILFSDKLKGWFDGRMAHRKNVFFERVRNYIIESVSVTLTASLCTMPLSIIYFGKASLISPLTNLLCVYAGSLFIMLGLVTVMLYSIPVAGKLLAFIPKLFVLMTGAFLDGVTELFSSIPLACVNAEYDFVPWFIAFTAVIIVAVNIMIKLNDDEKFRYKAVAAAFCSISSMLFAGMMSNQLLSYGNEIVVLGQNGGNICVVAKSGTHAMFAEAGGDAYDMIYAEDILNRFGVQHIDAVTVSQDSEERSGMADELIEKYAPDYAAFGGKDGYAYAKKAADKCRTEIIEYGGEIKNSSVDISVRMYKDSQNKCWQFVRSGDVTLLICPEGGDCSMIPDEFRKCDVVAIGDAGVTNTIYLTTGAAIVAASSNYSAEIAAKLRVKGIDKIYQTTDGTYRLKVKKNRLYILCD